LEIVGVWLDGLGHVGSCRGWKAHNFVCVNTHMSLELYRRSCHIFRPVNDVEQQQHSSAAKTTLANSLQVGVAPGLQISVRAFLVPHWMQLLCLAAWSLQLGLPGLDAADLHWS
jgi:hypothetical protein